MIKYYIFLLQIRDSANSTSLGKFCGAQGFQKPIQSSANSMTIVFRTDASDVGRGFSMRYTTGIIKIWKIKNALEVFQSNDEPNFPLYTLEIKIK